MDELSQTKLFSEKSYLKHLNISECRWERNAFSKPLSAIKKVYTLQCINFSGCNMDDKECGHLADSITTNNQWRN